MRLQWLHRASKTYSVEYRLVVSLNQWVVFLFLWIVSISKVHNIIQHARGVLYLILIMMVARGWSYLKVHHGTIVATSRFQFRFFWLNLNQGHWYACQVPWRSYTTYRVYLKHVRDDLNFLNTKPIIFIVSFMLIIETKDYLLVV